MTHTKPVSASTKKELLKRLTRFIDETPIFVYDGWGFKRPAFISYTADEKRGHLVIGVKPNDKENGENHGV